MSDGPAAADHLSLDALAELQEGIAENADALRRHLDGCAVCRKRAGQLHASRALLSTLPADPMPAEVAARIDTALAAEAASATTFAPGGNIVPMRGRRTWMRGPNLAAAAAGVAVLALASALVIGHNRGSKSPTESADKSVGRNPAGAPLAGANPPELKQWQTGANYTTTNRAGLVSGLVLGNPPPFPTPAPSTASSPVGGAGPRPSPGATVTFSAPGNPTPASFSRDDLRDPATAIACATLLAAHPVLPLAVDYAKYDGVSAVILVLPGLQHPEAQLSVYVIRSTCSDSATDLSVFTVDRPA